VAYNCPSQPRWAYCGRTSPPLCPRRALRGVARLITSSQGSAAAGCVIPRRSFCCSGQSPHVPGFCHMGCLSRRPRSSTRLALQQSGIVVSSGRCGPTWQPGMTSSQPNARAPERPSGSSFCVLAAPSRNAEERGAQSRSLCLHGEPLLRFASGAISLLSNEGAKAVAVRLGPALAAGGLPAEFARRCKRVIMRWRRMDLAPAWSAWRAYWDERRRKRALVDAAETFHRLHVERSHWRAWSVVAAIQRRYRERFALLAFRSWAAAVTSARSRRAYDDDRIAVFTRIRAGIRRRDIIHKMQCLVLAAVSRRETAAAHVCRSAAASVC